MWGSFANLNKLPTSLQRGNSSPALVEVRCPADVTSSTSRSAPDAEEQLDGEADAEAAGGFLKEAEEGLPTEDAVANDESVGADTPEEAAEAEEAAPAAPAGE